MLSAASGSEAGAGGGASSSPGIPIAGGSTGLAALADRIAAQFPSAQQIHGNRFASVAQGLGLHARRLFG